MRWHSDILSMSSVFSQPLTLTWDQTSQHLRFDQCHHDLIYFMIFQLFGISWYTCKITTIMQCFRFEPLCREALPDAAAKPPADVEAEPEESAVLETHFCVLHTKWTWWWPTQACSSQSVMNLILLQCDISPSTILKDRFSWLFYPLLLFGICAHVAGWELRFTRSKGLCQVLDRCWYPFGPLEVPFYGID